MEGKHRQILPWKEREGKINDQVTEIKGTILIHFT